MKTIYRVQLRMTNDRGDENWMEMPQTHASQAEAENWLTETGWRDWRIVKRTQEIVATSA